MFNSFIGFVIIANTIVLATDHYNSSSKYNEITEQLNFNFFAIFIVEMILKLVGYGFS